MYIKYFIIFFICFQFIGCGERKVVISDLAKSKENNIDFEVQYDFKNDDKSYDLENWETIHKFDLSSDINAKKGGKISIPISEFPPTYRTIGKDTRLMILSLLDSLIYESLLSLNPKTLHYEPNLATHWKISKDKSTYLFKINPDSRWSDGSEVTSLDVVSTFKLVTDPGILDPAISELFKENFEIPVALTKHIVKVKCKKNNWRNFMTFSGMGILPHLHCSKVDGESYLRKYKYQMMPGSGPYKLDDLKTIKGKQIFLKRRLDYWAINLPQNKGYNNFDKIIFKVISDDRLALEKFKKGEFDLYIVSRAAWWKEELNEESFKEIKNGNVIKKKFFNHKPLGMSGLAFNTLEKPFNDIKVRKAFSMLWNVDELIDKLFYSEYIRCKSYFQGTVYENKANPKPLYDPHKALKLLEEAGYKRQNGEKWMKKDNKIFEVEFLIDPTFTKIFTPFQQDLENVGIKLNFILMNGQAIFEKIMKKQYMLTYMGWTGLLFPNPLTSMHSKYAELHETNNITGIQLKEIDSLVEMYDKNYNVDERIQILRKLDSILVKKYYYAFGWVAPFASRVAFWDKFGYPSNGLSYSGDWRSILVLWWQK